MPLISVVIPTYNRAGFIEQAVQSVLDQPAEGMETEAIVADDGSTDATAQILGRFGGRIQHLRLEHCGRPGRVRNEGLQHAKGEYVAFLDSDDYLLPNSLARRLDVLQRSSPSAFVYGNYLDLHDGRSAVAARARLPSGNIFLEVVARNIINTDTVLAPRSVLERCDGFHSDLRTCEDYYLWLQLAARFPAAYVPEPLAVYRHHAAGVSKIDDEAKYRDLMRAVLDFRRNHGLSAVLYRRRVTPLRLRLATLSLRKRNLPAAGAWWARAFLSDPLTVLRASLRIVGRGWES
jgi:glycosyltransferase involved in cell wall biosynthesis